jgi:hypothetical protein
MTLHSHQWAMVPAGSSGFVADLSGTENPISEGGIWVGGAATGLGWHNVKTTGGQAVGADGNWASRYADNLAHLNTSYRTFSANQYAQATVYKAGGYTGSGGSHEVELLLRFSISANDAHGYEVLWGVTGYIAIVKWLGTYGTYTALYDSGAGFSVPADGDTLRAELSGSTLNVWRNGTLVPALTNFDMTVGGTVSMWNSGQPGMGFWPVDGATPENLGWKAWAAGNL